MARPTFHQLLMARPTSDQLSMARPIFFNNPCFFSIIHFFFNYFTFFFNISCRELQLSSERFRESGSCNYPTLNGELIFTFFSFISLYFQLFHFFFNYFTFFSLRPTFHQLSMARPIFFNNPFFFSIIHLFFHSDQLSTNFRWRDRFFSIIHFFFNYFTFFFNISCRELQLNSETRSDHFRESGSCNYPTLNGDLKTRFWDLHRPTSDQLSGLQT